MGWKFGQTFETTVVSNVLNYVCIYIYICSNQQLRYPFLSSTFNCNRNGQFKKEEEEEKKKGTLTSNHTLKQQDRGKRYNGLQKKIYDQIGKDTGMVALLMAVLSFVLLPKRSEYL